MSHETQCLWAKQIIKDISAAFPTEVTVTLWPVCQRLLPQVQMCVTLAERYQLVLPEAALLFNQADYYLREQAHYTEAEVLYKNALAIRERVFGRLHLETSQALYNLARLYFDVGQYDLLKSVYEAR